MICGGTLSTSAPPSWSIAAAPSASPPHQSKKNTAHGQLGKVVIRVDTLTFG